MSAQILIIEDEEKISRLLEMELNFEGYVTGKAVSGIEGLEKALIGGWTVILLDIMLPKLSGIEVLRRLRQAQVSTPIILLTARDTTSDIVHGLDLGANDYVKKPFKMEELLARIRTCIRNQQLITSLRSPKEGESDVIEFDDLSIYRLNRTVMRQNVRIDLTPKEFDLLLYLVRHRNQVQTREQLINHVWGYEFVGDTNIVDVYIRYLRKKIDYPFKGQLIQTCRGVGYCIKEGETRED
ncbi:response regulator transcription factor [Paenibacillus cremeus]|uniref:Response regulator transcription factor n=1 Tax=Paenibacillus cremeus TaxID=2163881 RepID=A0A559K4D3_9BACL|nr:response regulator transcription factor [Paenibacillus cremeus]TVY07009.1 response regulator transcription factor [Paenibacillus cremeus]